ncbi:MAG: hypothetical protein Q4B58_08150 [Bacteroidales bacterium]|nr:hypothetical protein [Bacteroidales bacterium]
MGPLSQTGMKTFMVLLSIVMVFVQIWLGHVPTWMLVSNWLLAGAASYILWDCVDRYRLGRVVMRGSVIVPWIMMASMANFCCVCFSDRFLAVENYLALICFLFMIRVSMSIWQKDDAVQSLVWEGLMIGAMSAFFPGMLLWLSIVPLQIIFMRCATRKNLLVVISGMLLGIWCSFCYFFFWGGEGSLLEMADRYRSLLVVEWDPNLVSLWQWVSVGVVLFLTIFYCIVTVMLNVSNTIRAQSINHLLCICQIMVLLFTLLDMAHLPVYMLLQTMLLGLHLIVILANSRGYLSEWWTLSLILFYMALSVGPYLPSQWWEMLYIF